MGTVIELPTMVIMYLQLIERINHLADGHDSGSNEAKVVSAEMSYYFEKIKEEMAHVKKIEGLE